MSTPQTYQELSIENKQRIKELSEWIDNFFCNDNDNRTDSLIYANENGFYVHAVELMAGTGATDKEFDDIYDSIDQPLFDISRNEAEELCKHASILICDDCNNHMFTDSPELYKSCSNCLSKNIKKAVQS